MSAGEGRRRRCEMQDDSTMEETTGGEEERTDDMRGRTEGSGEGVERRWDSDRSRDVCLTDRCSPDSLADTTCCQSPAVD